MRLKNSILQSLPDIYKQNKKLDSGIPSTDEHFLDTLSNKLSLTTKQSDELTDTHILALPKELTRCLPQIV